MTQNELGSPLTDIPLMKNAMMAHTSLPGNFEAQKDPERFEFEPRSGIKKHPQRFCNTRKQWRHKSRGNQPSRNRCGDFHFEKQKIFLNRCNSDHGSLFFQ